MLDSVCAVKVAFQLIVLLFVLCYLREVFVVCLFLFVFSWLLLFSLLLWLIVIL